MIPATEKARTSLHIPRVIWQTWKNDGHHNSKTLWVERKRAEAMLSWIEHNPTWDYRLLDDDDMETYILNEYGTSFVKTLWKISAGASKADFWRYLVMYRNGGAYFDTDSQCQP